MQVFVALLLTATLGGLGVRGDGGRADAFIGYTEKALQCKERLPDCHEKAKHDGCLKDPYNMRTWCPISCAVTRCIATGTLKVRHKGYATPADTGIFAQRWMSRAGFGQSDTVGHFRVHNFPQDASKPEPNQLKLSTLGVGTYLGNPDHRTDDLVAAAVIESVLNGWNVIDTASNYRYGHAETAIGSALDALLSGGAAQDFLQEHEYGSDTTRDMLFIATKAGYTDEAFVKRLVEDRVIARRDVVNGHCLAPAYVNASVHASLRRMNLATVDLVYLHNPAEAQLQTAGKSAFAQKMTEAFRALEALRTAGAVRYYGVATWDCFRVPPTDAGHLELEEVVGWAKAAAGGGASGFVAIQLPVNADMVEAWSEPWQSVNNESMTLLQAAEKLGVKVFTSGPLGEGDLVSQAKGRLDGVFGLRDLPATAQKLLQLARSTPGLPMVAALVGHKAQENVVGNVAISRISPIKPADFLQTINDVRTALGRKTVHPKA